MIPSSQITGLVLAGGRGSRMGGVDKGLQPHRGEPLTRLALERLRPQVGALRLSANRNLDLYAGFGVPVCPDLLPEYPGPLAGLHAGLSACTTPWLVSVPCDTPDFPPDLVARLTAALQAEGAEVAVAACLEDGVERRQPVFCLVSTDLEDDLAAFLQTGERAVGRWLARHRVATAVFDDAAAFFNANTPDDLERLRLRSPG